MKKINWGTGIAIVYTGFALMIIFLVIKSSQQNIDLVADDYYARELEYQHRLDEINRANALPERIRWKQEQQEVIISYPAMFKGKQISGKVEFFRPSDRSKDLSRDILVDAENSQRINISSFHTGKYDMRIHWTVDDVSYYTEEIIII
jgi:hypothetical protein